MSSQTNIHAADDRVSAEIRDFTTFVTVQIRVGTDTVNFFFPDMGKAEELVTTIARAQIVNA